jgi:glutathione S-transferase
MTVTLYGMKHSHPVLAARLMLRRKGIAYNTRDILPGLHAAVVRFAGFEGRTVPAMQIGDRKVQGTLEISRALDEAFPRPALFPADAERRAAVEEAERWAHEQIQPIAMRVFRWAGEIDNGVRAWMASEVMGWPGANALGYGFKPVMMYWARVVDARAGQVREDLANLPERLAEADRLIDGDVIGSDELNAADCQIFSSLRLLASHQDLCEIVAAYRCGRRALELVPDFPIRAVGERPAVPVPAALPPEWLPAPSDSVSAGAMA